MKNFPQLAARVLNTPLLLEPSYARVFFSALSSRLNITELADAEGQILTGEKIRMSAESWSGGQSSAGASSAENSSPGNVTRTRINKYGEHEVIYHVVDFVAIVPVQGTLVHKFGYLNPTSGMTGYDGIIQRARLAFDDPEVKGVMLDNDTPGGEVAGCFDTSRTLRKMADAAGKPLWALCYDMNCSAGMALASSAHRRLITQTGIAGSVGVVMAHQDLSKRLEKNGVKVTLIHSGSHKIDGNPYAALPKTVLEQFQQNSDQLRNEFAQIISDHMGLSLDAVLATEAAVYRGQAAIDIGFADELVNGHEAIPLFSQHLSTQGRTISIGATMENPAAQAATPENPAPAAGTETPAPQAAVETPAAGLETNSRAEERARIQGIVNHAEAEGRGALANHLAYETDMSIEAAGKVLAASGQELPSKLDAGTSLDALMASEEQPNLSADAQTGDADVSEDQKVSASAVSAYKKATGAK